jgi:PIN domain nuclease of toxin-antitoxin system
MTGEVGITAVQLDALPGDPTDRIIAATVLLREAIVLTADRKLLEWSSNLACLDTRL